MGSPVFNAVKVHPALLATIAAPALLAVVSAGLLVAAAFGYQPLWPEERVSLSEAIILRDLGTLVEWLEDHPDISARYPVRPGLVREAPLSLTPYEAAIAAQRDDVVRFLAGRGVMPPPHELPRLQCLAANVGARDLLALFGQPPTGAPCADIKLPW